MANRSRRTEATHQIRRSCKTRRDPACTRSYARPATDLANNPSGRTPSGAGGVRSVRDGAERDYPGCVWMESSRTLLLARSPSGGDRAAITRWKMPAQLGRWPPRRSSVLETKGGTTKRRRSSITELAFHGIHTSRSHKAKSVSLCPVRNVTYVSGRSLRPACASSRTTYEVWAARRCFLPLLVLFPPR